MLLFHDASMKERRWFVLFRNLIIIILLLFADFSSLNLRVDVYGGIIADNLHFLSENME